MRAAVFRGPGTSLEVLEVPSPTPSTTEALVRVAACGVCHSDLHYLEGVPTFKKPPLILGHEASGTVEAVGAGATHVKVGDRVLVPPVLSCGVCNACRLGRENICERMLMVGNSVDGAYGEYIAVPAKDLVPLPDDIPLQDAAIISDALSTPFHAVRNRGQVRAGDVVAIYGCGGVGLNAIQVAVSCGAEVVAVDIMDEKLKLAQDLGAACCVNAKEEDPVKAVRSWSKGGASVAFEVIGNPETVRQASESIRPGGRLVLVGYTPKDIVLSASRIMFRELEVVGALGCRVPDYRLLTRMVARGSLRLLVSDRYPLEGIGEAFRALKEGRILSRAVVIP